MSSNLDSKLRYELPKKMKWKIGNVEIPNRFVLAPMAGVTDLAFRRLCKEQGAKAKAEQSERHKEHALRKAHRHDDERDDGHDKADEQRLVGTDLVDDRRGLCGRNSQIWRKQAAGAA